ncbi:Vacuolar protein 8 [Mortierella alpina]|nr:Vacuolar protein 8 [Mortierella alpina]
MVLKVVTANSEDLPVSCPGSPRHQSTPPPLQHKVASPTSKAPSTTPAIQAKPNTPALAITKSSLAQSSTSNLPPVTVKEPPLLNSLTCPEGLAKAGAGAEANVSSKDTHLDSQLAALEITTAPDEGTSKSSKKKKKKKKSGQAEKAENAVVVSQSQQTWSEADQLTAERSLAIFMTCIDAVDRDTFRVIIHLIETDSATIQDKASTVLIRFVKDVVELGGLKSLRHLLLSIKSLHRNYLAAVSRMASKESVARVISQDKETVAAIARLVQEDDLEGQKLALGAISNLSEAEGFMQIAIQAGLIPTIVRLARSTHGDFGMRCLTALWKMTSDKTSRGHLRHLTEACPGTIKTLRILLDSLDEETMGCAMMTLFILAGEEQHRQEIVAAGALRSLPKLLQSRSERVVVTTIGLINVLADTPGENDLPIIESGCLERLIELLVHKKSLIPTGQGDRSRKTIVLTFTLLLEREGNRKAIFDMDLVPRLSSLVLKESPELQTGMIKCFVKLSEQAELRPRMLQMGILSTLFQLAKSTTSVTDMMFIAELLQQIAEDAGALIKYWTTPEAGLRRYIVHLLESGDVFLSKMALDVLLALVDDPPMKSLIEQADTIKVPFLCMVELMEGLASDKTESTETRMLSMLVTDTAQLLFGLLEW